MIFLRVRLCDGLLIDHLGDPCVIEVEASFAARTIGGEDHEGIVEPVYMQGDGPVFIVSRIDRFSEVGGFAPSFPVPLGVIQVKSSVPSVPVGAEHKEGSVDERTEVLVFAVQMPDRFKLTEAFG